MSSVLLLTRAWLDHVMGCSRCERWWQGLDDRLSPCPDGAAINDQLEAALDETAGEDEEAVGC